MSEITGKYEKNQGMLFLALMCLLLPFLLTFIFPEHTIQEGGVGTTVALFCMLLLILFFIFLAAYGGFIFLRPDIEKLKNNKDLRGLENVLLHDKEARKRYEAAKALGEVQDPHAIPSLLKALGDKDYVYVASMAKKAIIDIGDPNAINPLIDLLNNSEWRIRELASEILISLNDSNCVEPLLLALRDEWPAVRANAIYGLTALGERIAIEPFFDALNDENHNVRRAAAWGLGEFGDPRAARVLMIQTLKDNDQGVKAEAALAIGKLKDQKATGYLIQSIHESSPWVKCCIAEALANLGDARAIQPLEQVLANKKSDDRKNAFDTLMRARESLYAMPQRSITEFFIKCLSDENKDIRAFSAYSLGMREDPYAVQFLIEALNDINEVRNQAIFALGKIGDPRSVEVLESLIKGKHETVRERASEALSFINEKSEK